MSPVVLRLLSIAVLAPCLAALSRPALADDQIAIASGGLGDLTMCSYRGCNLYHHIELPARLAVGDTVRLRYGSNPKLYDFTIARIVRRDGGCIVYSQTRQTEDVEKIELASCKPAAAQ